MKAPRVLLQAALLFGTTSFLLVACAYGDNDALVEPVLLSQDSKMISRSACVERTCPAPFATCPGVEAPCGVDLNTDVEHCGACETPCPKSTSRATFLCSEGACRLACSPLYADCNKKVEDGCETSVGSDPKNCGGCGLACDDGEICWMGACGCPTGLTQCGNDCKDLESDTANCGACGDRCTAPADSDPRWRCGPGVAPDWSDWRCTTGECQQRCKPGHEDCDGDFCGSGCETLVWRDPKNCGACGHACDADQACIDGTCMCPDGLTNCGGECVDLAKDPAHCGSCGNECPGPSAKSPGQRTGGGPSCEGGECSYVCYPGFADCDGDLANGCEADLDRDQLHCGSCDNACEIGAGQPCVRGACLTKPCSVDPIR